MGFGRLYDAHNHLQDERFAGKVEEVLSSTEREHICRMVVNGSSEEDWPAVLELAEQHSCVIPSFGYHPWYVKERSPDWEKVLAGYLARVASGVGEIGLDKWIKDYDLPEQEWLFIKQLEMAAERNLPTSIHCLQAWGKLLELLSNGPRPRCGFLLHSYGGPRELIEPLAKLGAYFSLPGYFAHERKHRQRDTFRDVPRERLLIETDAPDQSLPASLIKYPLTHLRTGKPVNHPANLPAVYQFAAELLEEPIEQLASRVEENFLRLFGGICSSTD